MRRSTGMCMAALWLAASASAALAGNEAPYRDALIAALDLRDQALRSSGRSVPDSNALRSALVAADPDFLARLTPHLPPADEVQARLARARAQLDAAGAMPQRGVGGSKDIGFPEPDPISDCVDATPSAAHAMLEAWSASSGVLAAAKWACLQTDLGENGSEFCTALAIETESLETEYQLETFCLGAQRDATMAAVAQTQQNVADFLNQRADATLSSRATQSSVDDLQVTLDSLLQRLTGLRTALDEDENATSSGLSDLLDDALALAAQLVALSSDVHDLRFRTQAVQVDIEDVQRRIVDAQSIATRLAVQADQLRVIVQAIQADLDGAQASLQAADRDERDRRLATALGDPDVIVIRYRLPIANGGELERSREVLIRALNGYASLGADTAAASALLVEGDQAYNQGRHLDAYDAFARAYRLLLGAQTAAPALIIARDSFE